MNRCRCGAILPANPYRIGNSKSCEACYARWVRDGIEIDLERIERDRSRVSSSGASARCRICGGLFKASRIVNRVCETCDDIADIDGDEAT